MLPTSYLGRGFPKNQFLPKYEGCEYLDIESGIYWIVENASWVEE